jgi:hypothetical protein
MVLSSDLLSGFMFTPRGFKRCNVFRLAIVAGSPTTARE